jgi:predicted RNA methylase
MTRGGGHGDGRRAGARGEPRRRDVELVFLPGLEDVVRRELADRIPQVRRWQRVPGREDSLAGTVSGPPAALSALLGLRTVVAPFAVLTFPVPRPRSLLSGEHLPAIVAAIRDAVRLHPADPPRSLRIEAAGRDSIVLRTLAGQLAQATGLREDPAAGHVVLRLRPSPYGDGWDVLVRLTPLPLSARPWRVAGFAAAANATVAAAMALLADPRVEDRVVNLMCGSGTLLIERLLLAPARRAVGLDRSPAAAAAAADNLAAAGLADRVELLTGDVGDDVWLERGPFDCLLADPPWGDKSGRHAGNERLHRALLERAYAGAAPRARLLVLTHEIRVMERCLRAAGDLWRQQSQTRVFHKGHHPRIYALARVDGAA